MRYYVYCRKSEDDKERQVLSIPSQRRELEAVIASIPGAVIVKEFREEQSAKVPGRPLFNEMMRGIERGEADGIIAWAPNRMARNPVDAGTLFHLLQRKKLKDLKFKTFRFENTPQGHFMLAIMFAESKYYVDQLSQNLSRTYREKALDLGVWPGRAKMGYVWDRATKRHVPDPQRFRLVKEIFRTVLSRMHTAAQVWRMARDEWGLTTRATRKRGGKPLARSAIYRILTDIYYAGVVEWPDEEGTMQSKSGVHEPMITLDEYDRIQEILGRKGRVRPKRHTFAFTGLIRCGECGLAVTAENQTNRYGYRYVYYHCTRKRTDYDCRQPFIALPALEEAIAGFVGSLSIAPHWIEWVLKRLERKGATDEETLGAKRALLTRSREGAKRQLANLTSLRIRDLLSDEEFAEQRPALVREGVRIDQELEKLAQADDWFEPVRDILEFRQRAVSLFKTGTEEVKRRVFKILSSNPLLTDKMLKADARKPFRILPEPVTSSLVWAV
jgi:site-specific DNA recombinase